MTSATLPPIGLESLSIRDFRGIDNLDLDFRRPDGRRNSLVVLAGPNGCGKTTVLEAALIAVGGYKLVVGPLGRRAVRKGAEDFEIRARVSDWIFEEGETFEVVYSARSEPPTPDPKRPHWYFSSWRAPSLVGSVNVTVGKPGRRPAKNDPNRLRNVKQQLTNAAAAQSFPGSGKPLLRNYSKWIARIDEAWATFYPGRSDGFFVDLVDLEEGGAGAFDVFYRSGKAPPLPVDDLSAGQLELFLFLAALALNDDRQGIIFIDEPELHLDPQWHAPILRALMRLQPSAQFIVATHSPAIYETAKSYERHFLVPEDDPRAAIWGGAVARP